jgi:pimeloyl-ACP methyl ester carboxylesterase
MIRRCFANVSGRAVHYRRAGEGPPVVMLHGSPGDSQMLLEEIAACAEDFTVFAFDTAGFGFSDPLPGDVLTVTDLARAVAEVMRAVGLPPCPVYGTHTGAAIAIELGLHWPEQVTGLVMEGLPAFTEAEIEALFSNYFAPMVPDPLGGHLTATWIRFRDQFTWFPWPSRSVARLNPLDRPDPASIDLWVSMFYRSCKTYRPAYRAACHYGQAAIAAAASLRSPAIYTATVEDMLSSHLDRLPLLQPDQRIERLPSELDRKCAAIKNFLAGFATGAAAPPHRQDDVGRLYVDGPRGQIFVRCYGNPKSPALMLLHDIPGTSLSLQTLAQKLAKTHYVIVADHPGSGLTDAPGDGDILQIAAENIIAVADALAVGTFIVAGIGTGAAVATRLSSNRITRLVIADIPATDPAQIAPDIALHPTGAHWVQAWLMLRDNQIYAPWYDGTIAAQRHTQGNFDAVWRQDETAAFMEGRATYFRLARAAADLPTAQILSASGKPVLVLPEETFVGGDAKTFQLEEQHNAIDA